MATSGLNKDVAGGEGGSINIFQMLKKRRQQRRQQAPPPPASSSAMSSLKSGDPVSLESDAEETTEIDMTETERNEGSSSSVLLYDDDDDDRAVVVPHRKQRQQLVSQVSEKTELSSVVTDRNRDEQVKAHQEEEATTEEDVDADDGPVMAPALLVRMLRDANLPDPYARRRRLKQPNRSLGLEDLTQILSHVNNVCDDSDTDPRWDAIYELAYGDHPEHDVDDDVDVNNNNTASATVKEREGGHDETEQTEEDMILFDMRSSGSSRMPRLSEDAHEMMEDSIGPVASSSAGRSPQRTGVSNDSQSLSLGDLVGSTKNNSFASEAESAFTLEACTHSVDSSVTWFEGPDITEVEISDEDLEEFLPTRGRGWNSDDDDHDASDSGDSTPPPPPSNVDIMYSPPPLTSSGGVGLSLGEEDSLSRCYRRRRPRRYAEAE